MQQDYINILERNIQAHVVGWNLKTKREVKMKIYIPAHHRTGHHRDGHMVRGHMRDGHRIPAHRRAGHHVIGHHVKSHHKYY